MVHDQILSVCSGIGGLDLGLSDGLRAVGRHPRTVCMVEGEAFAVATLAQAMQKGGLDECPMWLGDLRELPVDELPEIDWISGGYPCQPFSQAGRRLGEDDPRHIWPVILDLVRTLRPRGVFFENVAGHLTLGLDTVLRDLAVCGFRCAFGLYTAEEVGAPHRRERVFILGLADTTDERGEVRHQPGSSGERKTGDVVPSSQDMADLDLERLEGHPRDVAGSRRQETRATRSASAISLRGGGCRWPSRPGELQHDWEPPRTSLPELGRSSDGLPCRVDRLRALGNAVVPQQASKAFISLWEEVTRC